ncbi:MAG: delta 1-pyrroline-5-carboxylate synthetase [Methanobrevibacter sp.]|nr:delta 1-pyrroline-5-carboxylate synthetase [Candidatus Methanovirga basalitermitum]
MEWVVKIGGSLFPEQAIKVAKAIEGTDSLIITGGGEFANLIREYDKKIRFSNDVTHQTAISTMNITSKLLNDKLNFTKIVDNFDDAKKVSENGEIPILICSKILNEKNQLEHSWKVSSDSISAYISHLLKSKLLITTNVNGIYTRKPILKNSILINEVDAKKLLSFDESSIDLMLPELLIKFGADCFVVNGKFPERVSSIIKLNKDSHDFKYTYIRGE